MGFGGKGKTGATVTMVRQSNEKVKGTGKKGGNVKGGKKGQEKRIDPSDGNGPFAYASFVKYHGEKKAEMLWKKAGAAGASAKPALNNATQKVKGVGKGAKGAAATKESTKGMGKTGKKGKGGKSKTAEKRMDPSDGNGPFTKESFIRFHGETKGAELWEQAECLKEVEQLAEGAANDELELDMDGVFEMDDEGEE